MNEEEPGDRTGTWRDGALARLRPPHGRVLRRGRGPVQRADGPAARPASTSSWRRRWSGRRSRQPRFPPR